EPTASSTSTSNLAVVPLELFPSVPLPGIQWSGFHSRIGSIRYVFRCPGPSAAARVSPVFPAGRENTFRFVYGGSMRRLTWGSVILAGGAVVLVAQSRLADFGLNAHDIKPHLVDSFRGGYLPAYPDRKRYQAASTAA